MDTLEGVSRYPSGFLFIHRPTNRVWIYDYVPMGDSPTGGGFQVRIQDGVECINDPDASKNRFRAADEKEFDIRVVNVSE